MDQGNGFPPPGTKTLLDLFETNAVTHSDGEAVTAPGRRALTYGRLLRQVKATVETLRAFGVDQNDRVAVVLPNGPDMAVAFLAVASGASCAPLNPAYRSNEFEFYMSDLGAKALLVACGLDSPAREVARKLDVPIVDVTPSLDPEAGIFHLVGEPRQRAANASTPRPDDVALVLHTSGTTARPKIVPLTQLNLCTSACNIRHSLNLTPGDRCLNVMPLFHIHGLIGALLSSMSAGASVVCTPGFEAEKFFGWLDAGRPTWYTAVPTMHQAVVARAAKHRDVISRTPLRFVRSSSASLPPSVLVDLENTFATRVIEAYSMTEASHQMTSNPLPPSPRKLGSVGIPAGPDVGVMDEAGTLLPHGREGEVVIRGGNVTRGYAQNPSANERAFTNGWFRTGDQGRFDEDGYLFLTGRLKELINRGGEKIAPREVDEILLQHPDIEQAVTFAVPHPTLGEDIAAAIVLRANVATRDAGAIREFAAARLADFKVPKQIVFVDEVPKGPTGKLQRIGLAEKLADKLAADRQQTFLAASTPVETQLIDIWRDLLNLDRVGVRDNFYALGGDSLATAALMSAIEKRFDRTVRLDGFLKSPTVETLATLLGDREETATDERQAHVLRDGGLKGLKNRVLQICALYAPGYKTTRVWLHRKRGVSIGDNVSIGLSAIIETAYPSLVFIGNDVSIGMRVLIIGHLRDSTSEARASRQHTVRIEDGAYIGPGVIILPNVVIGQGAVVSAGSVVSKSIPPQTLARGNPAEPIAHCGVSLGGGVSYEQFVRNLTPLKDHQPA